MGKRRHKPRAAAPAPARAAAATEAGPRTLAYAPMSPLYVLLTGLLLSIPVIWAILGVLQPPFRLTALALVSAALALVAFIALALRPRHLAVDEAGIALVFPLRELRIARADVRRVQRLDRSALRRALGFSLRVGLAGLFGSFGLMWSTRLGWISLYTTSLDDWVLIERKAARPVLISPADPAALLEALS